MFSGSRNLELINTAYFDDKYFAANKLISELLQSNVDDAQKLQDFQTKLGLEEIDLATVGNSLAAFISQR